MGKENEFLEACREGNLQLVQQLFYGKSRKLPFSLSKNGLPLTHCKDATSSSTPLHLAALNGRKGIVEFLLNNKADINLADAQGCLPLHLASWNGHGDIVELLLKYDTNSTTINHLTNSKETSLHFAAQYGHNEVARILVKNDADPTFRNNKDETALDLAAKNGRKEIVELLLMTHPQLLLNSSFISIADHVSQFSPLHLAARNGKTEIVRLLLDAGFDINLLTEEGTALHSASLYGKLDVVKLLLERGINVDAKDTRGRTVLQLLEEHRTRKSGTLSQSIKHLDVWQSCVTLIQGVGEKKIAPSPPSSLTTSIVSQSQLLYQNGTVQSSPVWMALPADCAERLLDDQKLRNAAAAAAVRLKPPLTVKVEDLSPHLEDSSICSTISLTPDASPLGSEPMSPRSRIAQKPIRPPRRACTYQPPVSGYDNVPADIVQLGYDNVPSNAIGYDNAPLPGAGSKTWSHQCGDNCDCSEDDPNRATPTPDNQERIETPQLSAQYQRLEIITPAQKSPVVTTPQKSPTKARVTWVGNYDNVPEMAPSTSPRNQSRTPSRSDDSVIEQTIQLIERSTTDIEEVCRNSLPRSKQLSPISVASPKLIRTTENGRRSGDTCHTLKAPLAQFDVEDLGTSTEGEIFLLPNPKSPTSPSQIPPVKTPSEPPPSIFDSERKISKKIRPLSEELLRTSPDFQQTSTRKSTKSCRPNLLFVDGETQVDSTTGSSECCNSSECSCSEGSRCSLVDGIAAATSTSAFPFVDDGFDNKVTPRPPKALPKSQSVTSPLDEQAEWRKIEEIFQSYGSAISRLSVFDNEIEPLFTNYLKNAADRRSVDSRNGNSSSPKRRVIERWLTSIGLQCYCKNFYEHGFDRLEFLKFTVDRHVLRYIGVNTDVDCEQIMKSLLNLPHASPKSTSVSNFRYISDWLHALGCQDSLGYFARRQVDSINQIMHLSEDDLLNVIGIPLFGHRRRLAWSIANAILTETSTTNNNTSATIGADVGQSTTAPISVWLHDPETLIGDGVSYVAHYLGSTEIRDELHDENFELEELRRTESTRMAICELKEKMRDNAKIPEVVLQIRYKGVRLLDTKSQHLLCEHFVQNIHCVCQDQRDMNCFAYNTKDGNRHFCHVFSVFTSDLAREIILTLGQAFEVAYQKALESGRV